MFGRSVVLTARLPEHHEERDHGGDDEICDRHQYRVLDIGDGHQTEDEDDRVDHQDGDDGTQSPRILLAHGPLDRDAGGYETEHGHGGEIDEHRGYVEAGAVPEGGSGETAQGADDRYHDGGHEGGHQERDRGRTLLVTELVSAQTDDDARYQEQEAVVHPLCRIDEPCGDRQEQCHDEGDGGFEREVHRSPIQNTF